MFLAILDSIDSGSDAPGSLPGRNCPPKPILKFVSFWVGGWLDLDGGGGGWTLMDEEVVGR